MRSSCTPCTLRWDGDDAASSTTPRRRRCTDALDARAGVRARRTSRCASSRPSSAAGSAARRCGSTRSWRRRRRSSRGARCGSTLSREGVYRIVGGRTLTEQRVALGADADGRFDGADPHRHRRDDAAQQLPEPFILPGAASVRGRAPSSLDVRRSRTWTCSPTPSCARPAKSVGTFALECAIDELADELGHRSDRAAPPQRARQGPDHRAAVLARGICRRPTRDGAERFGWAKRNAKPGGAARGRMADRHGLRHRDLPLLSHARRRRAHHASTRDGHATVAIAGARDGHGHRHGAGAGRRRAARPAAGAGDRSTTATRPARGRRSPAARSRRPRSARRSIAAQRALVAELLKLAGNDSPLAGLERRRGRRLRTAASRKLDDPIAARELRLHPARAPARRA